MSVAFAGVVMGGSRCCLASPGGGAVSAREEPPGAPATPPLTLLGCAGAVQSEDSISISACRTVSLAPAGRL